MFIFVTKVIGKLEETIHDIKTPGLNNPETYVLTHNRLNAYMVLFFSDINKAQIYKMPYRDSPHHEIEILEFWIFNLFKPNEPKEDYHVRSPNDENFLFEVEDDEYVYACDKVISLKTNEKIVDYSSNLGFNDIKFPFAYGWKVIYFMLPQSYIPIEEYENSTENDEY